MGRMHFLSIFRLMSLRERKRSGVTLYDRINVGRNVVGGSRQSSLLGVVTLTVTPHTTHHRLD